MGEGEKIRIVLRGEPTAKGRPKLGTVNGHAMAFTPQKTRTREGIVATMASDAMAGRPPLTGPLIVSLIAVMAIPQSWSGLKKRLALAGHILPTKRPDLDNILKLTTDAMNGIVFADDALIVETRARKIYGEIPQTVVEVFPDKGAA